MMPNDPNDKKVFIVELVIIALLLTWWVLS